MPNYSIRRATIDDIPVIQGMADVVFRIKSRRMLEFAKERLSEWNPEGCRIELNVNRGNTATGFYEHLGMVCDRQGDFPIGKGFYMNDFIYILDI